jgi:hypothetical protein
MTNIHLFEQEEGRGGDGDFGQGNTSFRKADASVKRVTPAYK